MGSGTEAGKYSLHPHLPHSHFARIDLSFLDFTASEVVGCFLKTCPLVDGSGHQRSLLTPNAVGKNVPSLPQKRLLKSHCLLWGHTRILQPAVVARAGVRLEVLAPVEPRQDASPGGTEDEMRAFSQNRTRIRLSKKGNGCWCQNHRCLF